MARIFPKKSLPGFIPSRPEPSAQDTPPLLIRRNRLARRTVDAPPRRPDGAPRGLSESASARVAKARRPLPKPIQRVVLRIVAGGEILGVGDKEIGLFLREGQEIFTLDAEGMIDEAVEVDLSES
jgi:hypothetical protein